MLTRLIAAIWTKNLKQAKLKQSSIGRRSFVINNRWPTWIEPMPKTAKERKRLGL